MPLKNRPTCSCLRIGLILAGLRPGEEPLPGEPPTLEDLRQVAATMVASKAGRLRPSQVAAPDHHTTDS